ncbi:hypothetical protein PF010_g24096 [Phytophthora fragariae]|uniref:Peptidase C45 hydrolase domain-containing protein n=1 Tax=Phytophthora fragariae TaxID=53985 RepID=A0A6G0K4H3_9STRA|nr:hypothetical protein PF010_g24096 [Phytophthora fragariae]
MKLVLFTFVLLLLRVCAEEIFEFNGDSHFEFGRQMGERFRDKIQDRMRLNSKLQTLLLPFARTPAGRDLLNRYLTTHRAAFPKYMEELEGVAEGSGVPFEVIFIENIVENSPIRFLPGVHVVAHNEDSGEVDVNRTAIVIAKIGDEPKFVAYTYLGDLPSGAFGFNENGVAFTLNFVQPAEIFVGGLGRGFISRDLLTAKTTEDAIAIITRAGQAAGHNFQLMDVRTPRVWNIEVASFNRHVIYEYVNDGENVSAFFHANQYQRLHVAQPPYQSSLHRLRRYSQLTPPTTIDEALKVLGDQGDKSWPVFHDTLSHERGDLSGWTLTTIVFDLDEGEAVSFLGNPALRHKNLVWDLLDLTVQAC